MTNNLTDEYIMNSFRHTKYLASKLNISKESDINPYYEQLEKHLEKQFDDSDHYLKIDENCVIGI